MKNRLFRTLVLSVALAAASVMVTGSAVQADEPELLEIVIRSQLTSVTRVYEEGFEGDPAKVIGFDTFSNVFIINIPTTNWVLPHPYADYGAPFGAVSAELRFPEGVYMDKSLDSQLAVGSGQLITDTFSISFAGTSIIRWVHDDQGMYQGRRWTDFSMGITETTGTIEGWRGHVVGTRLLIGDPDIWFQSGITIFRLLREVSSE